MRIHTHTHTHTHPMPPTPHPIRSSSMSMALPNMLHPDPYPARSRSTTHITNIPRPARIQGEQRIGAVPVLCVLYRIRPVLPCIRRRGGGSCCCVVCLGGGRGHKLLCLGRG
jgi:hypothetical protein